MNIQRGLVSLIKTKLLCFFCRFATQDRNCPLWWTTTKSRDCYKTIWNFITLQWQFWAWSNFAFSRWVYKKKLYAVNAVNDILAREGKGREGKGREGKGREGKGREK